MAWHEKLFEAFPTMVDNHLIMLLSMVILVDILTGIAKSFVQTSTTGKTSSSKGLKGVIKHGIVLFSVLLFYPYFDIQGLNVYADGFVGVLILTYAISIAENWGQMNLPGSEYLKKYLSKLQDDYDGRTDKEKLNDALYALQKKEKESHDK